MSVGSQYSRIIMDKNNNPLVIEFYTYWAPEDAGKGHERIDARIELYPFKRAIKQLLELI